MNFELHIISSRNGLEIVPQDGLNGEWRRCAALHQGEETLVVSLDSEIVHYVYLRHIGKKNSNDFFGFVISFNAVCFRNAEKVFDLMERLYETAVYEGLLVHVSDTGQVELNGQPFFEQKSQCQRIEQEARRMVDALPRGSFVARPRIYRTGNGDTTINLSEGDSAVADRMSIYDRVAIVREQSHSGLLDMQSRLRQLHEQSTEWEKKYHEEHKKKKQYSLVVVLLLILFLGGAVSAYIIRGNFFTIGSLNKNLEQKQDTIQQHQEHISELQDSVGRQMTKIKNLSEKIGKMENVLSRYASLRYTVGMPTINNNAFDEGYAMWFYAEVPIIIESIALRAKKTGYVSIVLRDADGNWVASETVSVNTFFSQKTVDLKVPSSGYYSLSIESDGVRLQYNFVNSETYQMMGSGPLRIKGCCEKGQGYTSARQSYYQYFYNIKYRVEL